VTRKLPSLDKEGWLRPLIKRRAASLTGADGVVGAISDYRLLNEPLLDGCALSGLRASPARPLHKRWLRTIFLDVAATPPYPRRGFFLPFLLNACPSTNSLITPPRRSSVQQACGSRPPTPALAANPSPTRSGNISLLHTTTPETSHHQ